MLCSWLIQLRAVCLVEATACETQAISNQAHQHSTLFGPGPNASFSLTPLDHQLHQLHPDIKQPILALWALCMHQSMKASVSHPHTYMPYKLHTMRCWIQAANRHAPGDECLACSHMMHTSRCWQQHATASAGQQAANNLGPTTKTHTIVPGK